MPGQHGVARKAPEMQSEGPSVGTTRNDQGTEGDVVVARTDDARAQEVTDLVTQQRKPPDEQDRTADENDEDGERLRQRRHRAILTAADPELRQSHRPVGLGLALRAPPARGTSALPPTTTAFAESVPVAWSACPTTTT